MRSETTPDIRELEILAQEYRRKAIMMVSKAGSSHVGSAMSLAEILTVLYHRVMNVSPEMVDDPNRDRFILSKGHAVSILYAVLANRGFFPEEWLDTFYQNDTVLAGHATHKGVPGVEVATGSLGHGLGVGVGMAVAAKADKRPSRTFVVLSDGEIDEGSIWEAIMFAGHHKLDNLVAIVDYNKVQSIGLTKEVLDLEPFETKWEANHWAVRRLDGHDPQALLDVLENLPAEPGKPTVIIADTVKGKGVSFMEGTVLWHYRNPRGEELEATLKEIDGRLDELKGKA